MDLRTNPYAPGAGTPPPELAGRDATLEKASIALTRVRNRLPTKSMILVGLRGVGKTVLLNKIRQDADAQKLACVWLESPEEKSLPALLLPGLRAALIRLSVGAAASDLVQRALRGLKSMISSVKVKYGDVEVGLDSASEPGLADSGDLDTDLSDLLMAVGEAAADRKTALIFFLDELQYVAERELAALITALHRCAQNSLPVALVGAGLPQLVGKTGQAKSYAERLFDFPHVGQLDDASAKKALVVPASRHDVAFTDDALAEILTQTKGYPYFLQEWGKHAWAAAAASPVSGADAKVATFNALAELDANFFRVRFDRLTPAEKKYLRGMAELGDGPHRSGDIAEILGRKTQSLGPVRSSLIEKGMIYSPAHGETGFTVPLFAAFMKRTMPQLS